MPIVKEPHLCQPPIWPWMYRVDTVWECPRCKAHYKIGYHYGKSWIKF